MAPDLSRDPTARVAATRLGCTLMLLLAVWHLGCQPAWSPDGNRVLYPARIAGDRTALACFDRAHDRTEVVFVPPAGAEPLPTWNGEQPLVLWRTRRAPALQLTVLDLDRREPVRSLPIPLADDPDTLAPPVVSGGELFFVDDGVARVDPRTGALQRRAGERGEELALFPYGDGVGYVAHRRARDGTWELGRVHTQSLERTRVVAAPPGGWRLAGIAAASRDGRSVAVPATPRNGAPVLLWFDDGELAATIQLGGTAAGADAATTSAPSLGWSPDGTQLVAGVLRVTAAGTRTWSLAEATRRGVVRETVVLRAGSTAQAFAAATFAFAVAPDGRTAAASTALLDGVDDDAHGLYLVDLSSPRRTVTRVPFPAAPPLLRVAADAACEPLVRAWADALAGQPGALPLDIVAATDVAARDDATIVVTLGAAPAADAGRRRTTVAHHAVAIVVPVDNDIAALTVAQLADVLRGDVRRWTELGVARPGRAGRIRVAGRADDAATTALVRELVLGGRAPATTWRARSRAELLRQVATGRGTLGVIAAGHVEDTVRTVPIAPRAGARAVAPEPAALHDGSYPLAWPVVVTTPEPPPAPAAALLAWLHGDDGRRATEAAGPVPVVR